MTTTLRIVALLGLLGTAAGLAVCSLQQPEPAAVPRPVFAVGAVSELGDARLGPGGSVLVSKQRDGTEQAIALDATGEVRWHSPTADRILLGADPDAPVYAVAPGAAARVVHVLAASTGQVQRTFTVARPRRREDTWRRDGASLLVIETDQEKTPATLVSIDAATGAVRWARDTGRLIPQDLGWVQPSPAFFTETSVLVLCQTPGSQQSDPDLCRFSRADGSLTATIAGPLAGVAATTTVTTFFLLRRDGVEAVSEEGASLWRHPLPANYVGTSLVARDRWLVVRTGWVKDKDHSQDRLIALDASDGHELWFKDSGEHGEHYQHDLALTDDHLFFVSNLDPHMRVVDRSGALVVGTRWKTGFVVSTEVVGGFVEGLRGAPVFQGPFLALAREKQGLEVYKIP